MENAYLESLIEKIRQRYNIISFRQSALESLITDNPVDGFDVTDQLLQTEYNDLQDEKEFIEELGVLGRSY